MKRRRPRGIGLALIWLGLGLGVALGGPAAGVAAFAFDAGGGEGGEISDPVYEPPEDVKEGVYGGADIAFEDADSDTCLDNCSGNAPGYRPPAPRPSRPTVRPTPRPSRPVAQSTPRPPARPTPRPTPRPPSRPPDDDGPPSCPLGQHRHPGRAHCHGTNRCHFGHGDCRDDDDSPRRRPTSTPTPAPPSCFVQPCAPGCGRFGCPEAQPTPGRPSCFLAPCQPGCRSFLCPGNPPQPPGGGPDFGGPGAAFCRGDRFGRPLAPLTDAVWVEAAAAAGLAARVGEACDTVAGVWLERTPYLREWTLDPPRPVLWSQSRLSRSPGSPTVVLTAFPTPGRRWTCTPGGTLQEDRPPIRRLAVEVTFTAESIAAIEGGRLQALFPGAYVHQAQTTYCKTAGGRRVTFDQREPALELIDPGIYHVRMRVCTDHACYDTDAHAPITMALLVTAAAAP